MAIGIISIEDTGNDVLLVKATDGEKVYEAKGWVSATTNHYDTDDYLPADENGNVHLSDKATPRAMTADEVRTYALRLIDEQHGVVNAPEPAKAIAFASRPDDDTLAAKLAQGPAEDTESDGA